MKIAFLTTRPSKPSYRFRIEQMLPYFTARRHECQTFFLPPNTWRRLLLYRRLASYDTVVLQKRLLSRVELFMLRRMARRLIYDLDDAVMYASSGDTHRRRGGRFGATAKVADMVVCGNQFLADEARRYSDRVVVVPTCINCDVYRPGLRATTSQHLTPQPLTIGWTGSRSTNAYLNEVLPALAQLHGPVQVKVISDTAERIDFSRLGRVPHVFVPWSPKTEIAETATFDVGLMPLPDNRWTQGKCGFKALVYMSLGIPAVLSPVGVNRDIMHDGVDGFFAPTLHDWFPIVARLAKDAFLRETIGRAGRRRVEEGFSLATHGPRFVAAVEKVAGPPSKISLRKSA
jgi:glycosyltransferase involved in cell wall biosynthesis